MGNWNSGRRKPTAMHMLNGNPGKRPLNMNEPRPEAARPDFDIPPDELTDDPVAIAEWARVVPLLRVAGILTRVERPTMIAVCTEWSRYMDAQRHLRREGMMSKDEKGRLVRNPYLRAGNDALKQLLRLWVEVGLTPSARARMTVAPGAPSTVASRWGDDV